MAKIPAKFSARFKPPLMRAVLLYLNASDVTPSRFLQRAAERELRHQARNFPKLKPRLEKLFKEIEEDKYGTSNSADGE